MKLSLKLVGMDRVRLKLAMVEPEVRGHVVTATEQTTGDGLAAARVRVPRRTGELESTLRRRYSRDGLTGYVEAGYGELAKKSRKGESRKSRALRGMREGPQLRGIYAPIVEFKYHPFLVPALESIRSRHNRRVADAIRSGLAAVASRGGK